MDSFSTTSSTTSSSVSRPSVIVMNHMNLWCLYYILYIVYFNFQNIMTHNVWPLLHVFLLQNVANVYLEKSLLFQVPFPSSKKLHFSGDISWWIQDFLHLAFWTFSLRVGWRHHESWFIMLYKFLISSFLYFSTNLSQIICFVNIFCYPFSLSVFAADR